MGLDSLFRWLLDQFHLEMNCQYAYICKTSSSFLREKQGKEDKPRTGPTAEIQQNATKASESKKLNRTSPVVSWKAIIHVSARDNNRECGSSTPGHPRKQNSFCSLPLLCREVYANTQGSEQSMQCEDEVLSRHEHCEAKNVTHPVTAHGNSVTALQSLRGTREPTNKHDKEHLFKLQLAPSN